MSGGKLFVILLVFDRNTLLGKVAHNVESWNPGLEEMERERGNGEIEREARGRGMKDREKG